jgi:hypothetical protein
MVKPTIPSDTDTNRAHMVREIFRRMMSNPTFMNDDRVTMLLRQTRSNNYEDDNNRGLTCLIHRFAELERPSISFSKGNTLLRNI